MKFTVRPGLNFISSPSNKISSFPVSKNSLDPIDRLSMSSKLIPGTFYFFLSVVIIIFGVNTLKLGSDFSESFNFLFSLR